MTAHNGLVQNLYGDCSPALPSRETDVQRAAELIYCSVIKTHGNS
jgi:hypothetical protein